MRSVRMELFIKPSSRECAALKLRLKEILKSMGVGYTDVVVERDVSKDPEAYLILFTLGKVEPPVLKLGSIFIKGKPLQDGVFIEAAVKGFVEELKKEE